MSDTGDDMEAGAAMYESWREQLYDLADKRLWRTKDGRTIPISGMSDSHINNCLRIIDGRDDSAPHRRAFTEELRRRGGDAGARK